MNFVHVEFFVCAMGFMLVDRTNGRMPLVWICLKLDNWMFLCFHDVLWLLITAMRSF